METHAEPAFVGELAELTQTEVASLGAVGAVTSLLDETLAAERAPVSTSDSRS
jgi:hypothetical protein